MDTSLKRQKDKKKKKKKERKNLFKIGILTEFQNIMPNTLEINGKIEGLGRIIEDTKTELKVNFRTEKHKSKN